MQTENNKVTVGCDLKTNDDFIDAMRYCYNDVTTVKKFSASM